MEILTPYQIKGFTIPNRIVMPAMCQGSADEEGLAGAWHLVHYGARAAGRVGLIIFEATAVEKRGRLSNNDLGVWDDAQVQSLAEVTEFCKSQGSVVGIQIAHGGRKAWGQELVAPSALAYPHRPTPRELTAEEIKEVIESWRNGARRAREAGFDLLQVHAAHGFLIHQFLSALSNQRTDHYGGSFENRLRLLLEIVRAVQEEWPRERILSVRLSAVDALEGGITVEDTLEIGRALQELGVDLLDISSGGLLPAEVKTGPGYLLGFAETVKKKLQIPVIAVGQISAAELVQEIIFNGRADFVALGRELLRDPHWVLKNTAAKENWPRQYQSAAPVS